MSPDAENSTPEEVVSILGLMEDGVPCNGAGDVSELRCRIAELENLLESTGHKLPTYRPLVAFVERAATNSNAPTGNLPNFRINLMPSARNAIMRKRISTSSRKRIKNRCA